MPLSLDASYSRIAGTTGVSLSSLFSALYRALSFVCFFFLNCLFMSESALQPSLGARPAFAKGISFSAARREAPINGQVPSSSHSLRVGIVGAWAFSLSASRSSKTPLRSLELFPGGL